MFAKGVAYLKAVAARRRAERELEEELRFHVEMETRANVERGMPLAEARRVALRDFAGLEQTREVVREQRATPVDWIGRDLAHTARALRRSPGFAATVVAALAIGIGGTTLVFSVVEALVIRRLPYADPDHLFVVQPFVLDWSAYERLRDHSTTFEEPAAYVERGANVTIDGESTRLEMAAVSSNFLEVAGIRPAAGRTFSEAANQGEHLVLLSDSLWRARFRGTPDAIGRTLEIDRVVHTVVGILPPDFRTIGELAPNPEPAIDRTVSLVVPAGKSVIWRRMRGSDGSARLTVVVRLRPGATRAAASREVEYLLRGPYIPSGTFSVVPVSQTVAGDLRTPLTVVSVAAALLFLVACANVVNLQLVRLAGRRREFAVRTALGAGTARLVSVAVTEMVVLGLAGGVAGLLLAWGGVRVVRATATPSLARLEALQLNGLVGTFAAAGTILAAFLTGVVPAWRISRTDPAGGIQAGSEGTVLGLRGVVPAQLVVWQVAAAVVLVSAGSLLLKDISRKFAFDPGFKTLGVLVAEVSPDPDVYSRITRRDTLESAHTRYCSRLLEAASRLPGVTAASLTAFPPGAEVYNMVAGLQSEGRPLSGGANIVSADYFSLLSIPIVAGRAFSRGDGAATGPVIVVNQALASRYWESERAALGRQVTIAGDSRPWTIVGVSADARDEGLWRAVAPRVYFLYTQFQADGPVNILLRARTPDCTALAKPLVDLARSLDPGQPVHRIMPLQAFVGAKLGRERQIVSMMSVFALFALALAAIGVHGVLSYAVTLRTREIAVRRALGSGARPIVTLVMRRSALLLGLGVTIALPMALALRWYLTYVLGTAVDPGPGLLFGAVTVVALASLAASLHPTRRAIRVEPARVLRSE